MNIPVDLAFELIGTMICILAQAFFAGSEIALVGSDRLVLKNLADSGDTSATRVLKLLERPTLLVGTCLMGTATFAVSGVTLYTQFLSRWDLPEIVVILTYAPVSIIVAELIPKSIFHQYATRLAPHVGRIIGGMMVVLQPVLWVMEGATRLVMRLLGVKDAHVHAVRREDIQLLLDDATIHASEKEMIQRVFEFSDTMVSDVMVPLIEVAAVSDMASCEEAAQLMAEAGHSRIPVYRKRIDRIVGMISHHDVIFADPTALVTTVMRPIQFAPETQRLDLLFKEMRRRRTRLAVAVNEYGGAVGIVSVEDILEEIVGEIDDEFSRRIPLVRRVAEREWVAAGRIEGERLLAATGFTIPEGDYETLAGFLLDRFGHIPMPGERLLLGSWVLTVAKATDRAILEVSLQDTAPRSPRTSLPSV